MLPSYLNLQHGPPCHPHQHCCDDEDGDEDNHATFIYSATQHGFPCHHYSHCSNRGHHCIIASKNDNESNHEIDRDSSGDHHIRDAHGHPGRIGDQRYPVLLSLLTRHQDVFPY